MEEAEVVFVTNDGIIGATGYCPLGVRHLAEVGVCVDGVSMRRFFLILTPVPFKQFQAILREGKIIYVDSMHRVKEMAREAARYKKWVASGTPSGYLDK